MPDRRGPAQPDGASRSRRRGDTLVVAIHRAVLDELAERGYGGLTMERVAERAGAGKASLYRRWGSRAELLRDTAYHLIGDADRLPDTGSLRDDLIAVLEQTAALLSGPLGAALRALLSEMLADRVDPEQLASLSLGMGRRILSQVTGRAVARGEIAAGAAVGMRLDVGQALLRDEFLFRGRVPTRAFVVGIVDDVLLPLLRSEPPAPQG